jgi:hypothetical protein
LHIAWPILAASLCDVGHYPKAATTPFYNGTDLNSMTNKCTEAESPVVSLKDESARQRWELFHRAIAHAKQSNDAALDDRDDDSGDPKHGGPSLSIVR